MILKDELQLINRDIYTIVDSFLAEAKDQFGNDRSLDRLNQDRHLAVEALDELMEQAYTKGKMDLAKAIADTFPGAYLKDECLSIKEGK